MAQTRPNKIVTITNDEIYDLATHQARMADSANVVIKVSSQAERDALPKTPGMAVTRLDQGGRVEVWDGTNWVRQQGPRIMPSANSQVGSQLAVNAFTTGDTQPIFEFGTAVITTDSAGYFTINYRVPFPNGVLMVMCSSGDAAQGRDVVFATAGSPFSQTVSTFFGSAIKGSGTGTGAATFRVNYIAVGW